MIVFVRLCGQVKHSEDRLWMACSIYCQRKDTGGWYTPRLEVSTQCKVLTVLSGSVVCTQYKVLTVLTGSVVITQCKVLNVLTGSVVSTQYKVLTVLTASVPSTQYS